MLSKHLEKKLRTNFLCHGMNCFRFILIKSIHEENLSKVYNLMNKKENRTKTVTKSECNACHKMNCLGLIMIRPKYEETLARGLGKISEINFIKTLR